MTREKAIKILTHIRNGKSDLMLMDALDMAIKALEQEPSGDVISRQAVNILVDELARAISDERCCMSRGRSTATIMQDILDLPSFNPQEPKTGHWIRWYEQKKNDCVVDNIPHCKCSECGKEYDPHSSQFIKYCNECGAKMVEPQETETWNGYHGQITAPKGTFERIFNDADDDNDI